MKYRRYQSCNARGVEDSGVVRFKVSACGDEQRMADSCPSLEDGARRGRVINLGDVST